MFSRRRRPENSVVKVPIAAVDQCGQQRQERRVVHRVAEQGGDTDTIGAMATAICGALHGAEAIEPGLLAELKRVNPLDIGAYVQVFARFRRRRQGEA